MTQPAVVFLTASGEATAMRAAEAVGGRVHDARGRGAAEDLRGLFAAGVPVVGVMAAGILVRALAPMVGDKRAEPAVVALAEDGSSAVPLLGGHRGANALARRLAEAFGGHAAVTTAGDLRLGVALDAPPEGWALENPEDAKAAMAGLLAGRGARLSGKADWLAPLGDRVRRGPAEGGEAAPGEGLPGDMVAASGGDGVDAAGVAEGPKGARGAALSKGALRGSAPEAEAVGGARGRATGPEGASGAPRDEFAGSTEARGAEPVVLSVEGCAPLVWRRRRLAVGVGCARGCEPGELIGLARMALAEAGFSAFEVASVHSIDVKADETAVHALARDLGVPARFHSAEALEGVASRLSAPSEVVFAEVGCHGVAEGAALVAAGPEAVLAVEKRKTGSATFAAAEIVGGGQEGRRRGRLSVVGIGPGAGDWRTPEASRLVAEAEELVGYGFYLDLLGPVAAGKPRADFSLGEEEARCRHALERAGEGRDVALVCSGDAGIYAMGALVMELMDRPEARGGVSAAARRVEVVNAPGVSALQAASARAGALLGHDFCAISLSDLLTPREDILKRLAAAAEGDFVIAFYNPVSRRRRDLLDAAREILLPHRGADAPVLLARSLGRAEETLTRRTLGSLRTDEVDMMTVVLVGSSNSRAFETGDRGAGAGGWRIYTPRGYAKKMEGGL